MLKKLTHVTLYTDDQEKTKNFYVDKLGMKVHTDADYDGMRWLTLHTDEQPDLELVLMPAYSPETQALVGKQSPGSPLFVFTTDDCKGEYERLKGLGVEFTQEPTQQFWGLEAICKDPHGNLIDINQG